MNSMQIEKNNLIAQWAFDTRPILGRFHLWLEDLEVEWIWGEEKREFTSQISFLEGRMERLMAVAGAVTALGTQLFGGFGEGKGLDKKGFNQVKKNADAVSAYAISESLWYLSRQLPENHAIMVCIGEGLMPKAGETPEMGSNPLLGFGRVYARPEVAKWLDIHIQRLLNDQHYTWKEFYQDIKVKGLTIWGAAIDTLENTSRFAKGKPTGPMTVIHLFNQPLTISKPYEGYIGNLFLPQKVVDVASDKSIYINFKTPRKKILEAILAAYPGIELPNIHVWTLRGESRIHRLSGLWQEWLDLGVHLVDEDWELYPNLKVFNDSGTYAPTFAIDSWQDENGAAHLFICDGYAASAEALQAASLASILNIKAFLSVFTSSFKLPYYQEQNIMGLDPYHPDFPSALELILGNRPEQDTVEKYRSMILEAVDAGVPTHKSSVDMEDFLPEKEWDVLSVTGFMQDDPYSGLTGVEKIADDKYRVTVRLAAAHAQKKISFTFRFMEGFDQTKLIFSPLLHRFLEGEDYQRRPVKISDSGRIRNELQTLCSEALQFMENEKIRIDFGRIPEEVIAPEKQTILKSVLKWYKREHPIWFAWLSFDE